MTRQGAPTPPLPTDAEYVRKLALAILGTLQNKGILSADEVDSILIAARRAAASPPAPKPGVQESPAQPSPQPPRQVVAEPSPPPGTLSWSVVPPPGEEKAPDPQKAGEETKTDEARHPPVIDFKLD